MTQTIMFPKGKVNIIADIFNIVLEPSDTGNGKQVVYFCKDKGGIKYRVPKSEVVLTGVVESKPKKDKKKKRKCA